MTGDLRQDLKAEKQTEIVSVRLGADLRGLLREIAQRSGLSDSQLLRELALDAVTGTTGQPERCHPPAASTAERGVQRVVIEGCIAIRFESSPSIGSAEDSALASPRLRLATDGEG